MNFAKQAKKKSTPAIETKNDSQRNNSFIRTKMFEKNLKANLTQELPSESGINNSQAEKTQKSNYPEYNLELNKSNLFDGDSDIEVS